MLNEGWSLLDLTTASIYFIENPRGFEGKHVLLYVYSMPTPRYHADHFINRLIESNESATNFLCTLEIPFVRKHTVLYFFFCRHWS